MTNPPNNIKCDISNIVEINLYPKTSTVLCCVLGMGKVVVSGPRWRHDCCMGGWVKVLGEDVVSFLDILV